MNEVEKMYSLAGVEPKRNYYCPECESLLEDWYSGDDYIEYRCADCEYAVDNRMEELNTLKFTDIYPPFTAEKQLELIKWIAENKEECRITYEKEYKWCTQTDWQSSFCYDNFPASLANLINNLWQDLTEAVRKQIKEILE